MKRGGHFFFFWWQRDCEHNSRLRRDENKLGETTKMLEEKLRAQRASMATRVFCREENKGEGMCSYEKVWEKNEREIAFLLFKIEGGAME